jgi:phage repressor protein C with HTH and peptisase S24 domain
MGLHAVRVEGESMRPTLRPGDLLLVRRGAPVSPGDLVVARPLARPELLVVKRARLDLGDGDWDVTADNPAVFGRGWTSGPAAVVGRVVLRCWPPGRPA